MKIETKYEIGQEVWFMHNNKPTCMPIKYIAINVHGIKQSTIQYVFQADGDIWLTEHKLFITKEELIASL